MGGGGAKKAYLGCIQSHAEAPGPVQLLGKGWAGASLPEDIKQRPSGTELCDDTGRLHTHAHEHHHIRVPQTSHDGHLHRQTTALRFYTMMNKGRSAKGNDHNEYLAPGMIDICRQTYADPNIDEEMFSRHSHNWNAVLDARTNYHRCVPVCVSTMIGGQT